MVPETTVPNEGQRVELKHTDDPYTSLSPGDQGIVTGVTESPPQEPGADPIPQIHVQWDNGSTLMLLVGVDEFAIIDKNNDENHDE